MMALVICGRGAALRKRGGVITKAPRSMSFGAGVMVYPASAQPFAEPIPSSREANDLTNLSPSRGTDARCSLAKPPRKTEFSIVELGDLGRRSSEPPLKGCWRRLSGRSIEKLINFHTTQIARGAPTRAPKGLVGGEARLDTNPLAPNNGHRNEPRQGCSSWAEKREVPHRHRPGPCVVPRPWGQELALGREARKLHPERKLGWAVVHIEPPATVVRLDMEA